MDTLQLQLLLLSLKPISGFPIVMGNKVGEFNSENVINIHRLIALESSPRVDPVMTYLSLRKSVSATRSNQLVLASLVCRVK